MSPEVDWEMMIEHVSRFAHELRSVGYKEPFGKLVCNSAVDKYKTLLKKHLDGEAPMYRDKFLREKEREEKHTTNLTFFSREGIGRNAILNLHLSKFNCEKENGGVVKISTGCS